MMGTELRGKEGRISSKHGAREDKVGSINL
jgi:hypothetical protein